MGKFYIFPVIRETAMLSTKVKRERETGEKKKKKKKKKKEEERKD